jgi:hypothetical protein
LSYTNWDKVADHKKNASTSDIFSQFEATIVHACNTT